jgi:glycosyltransferase involved in cell wall biosynthesis
LPGQNILSNGHIGLKGTDGPTIRPEQLYDFNPGYARLYDREWLPFFCTLVSREVIEKVGLLDEEFVNGCEDLDYCKRAAAIGFRCRVNEASFVLHFGSVSRSQSHAETPNQYLLEERRNQARVLSKYDRPLLVIHTGYAYEPWTEVIVFSDCEGSEGIYSGVEFQALNRFDRFVEMNHINVFVASRYVNLFDYNIRADKKYLWVHDVWAMGTEFGENDKVRNYYDELDGIFCLSPWHRDFFAEKHDVSPAKIIITGNGADPGRFDKDVEKQRYRFIYASSPDRGLDTLLDLFPRILREFPQAELHVFYGFDNWDEAIRQAGRAASRDWRDQIYQALNQPNVFYHGRVGQRELADEFLKSDIWFYPTRFTETYCITALEAQMAGAVCVCSDLAALQTTVGDRGILIPGDPYTEQYRRHALQQVFSIMKDDERKRELTNRAKDWARQQTWENRAKEWLSAFNSRKLAVSV